MAARFEAKGAAWLAALERAHDDVHRAARLVEDELAPAAALEPAARAIEAALGALYDAVDARADRLQATEAFGVHLREAARLLATRVAEDTAATGALRLLDAAARQAALAEESLRSIPPGPLASTSPRIRASRGLPSVHAVRRPSLVPRISVPEPPPDPPPPPSPSPSPPVPTRPPRTPAEIEEAADALREQVDAQLRALEPSAPPDEPPAEAAPALPPGFVGPLPPVQTEAAFLAAWARECFDEVVMLGHQRAPLLGDPWRVSLPLDRRLLAAVDALAGLGPEAIARLEPLALDAPAAEPGRVFAITLIAGCLAGRDALGAAERVLRRHGAKATEVARSFVAAAKLAPHPDLPRLLRGLLDDADPAYRALAAEVLVSRELLDADELGLLARGADAATLAQVLPALARTAHPELEHSLRLALAEDDAALREAAWIALAYAGHPRAAAVVKNELDGPFADRAALMLAIVGDEADARALAQRAHGAPSPSLAEALGWAGAVEAVPRLIELVASDDEALASAAADALVRLTGAALYEEIEVDPGTMVDPDVPDPDVGEPPEPSLAALVSDPRHLPAEGSRDKLVLPSRRPEAWRAYWAEAEKKSPRDPRQRLRRGQPYTPAVSLWELDQGLLTPRGRGLLHVELAVRTGRWVRFDPLDWVAAQEAALAAWEPLARAASGQPGAWTKPKRR